jgi:hypothetical protein
MLDGVLNPAWPVIFGVALSCSLFAVKLVVAREPKFDDIIVGLSDIPTVLTASACSLLVAFMFRGSGAAYINGTWLLLLIVIFLVNVCIYRFVENRKRSLSSDWKQVSFSIALSFSISIFISFNIVSTAYSGIQQ